MYFWRENSNFHLFNLEQIGTNCPRGPSLKVIFSLVKVLYYYEKKQWHHKWRHSWHVEPIFFFMKKIKLFAKFLISSKSNKDRLLLSKEIAANVFVSWFGIIAEKMDVSPKAYAGIRRLLHLRLYAQGVKGPFFV